MDSRLSLSHNLVSIDDRNRVGKELTIVHPTRRSIICVSSSSLSELDVATGALTCEISFDLPLASSVATSSTGPCNLEIIAPTGNDHVVGICQMSNLVAWNLRTSTLECVVELERGQSSKGIVGFATSLCREQWLFYSVEGSTSIKVLSLAAVMSMSPVDTGGKDHGLPFKKISRKTTNRSSHLTALSYNTSTHLLACGSSDGSFQLWAFAPAKSEDDTVGGSSSKDDVASVTLLYTSTPSNPAPIVHLAFGVSSCAPNATSAPFAPTNLVVAYQSRVVEAWSLAPLLVVRRPREPQRFANAQLPAPSQSSDFSRKSGELCIAMHNQLPLLVVGWNPALSMNGGMAWSSMAMWRFDEAGSKSSINWRVMKPMQPVRPQNGTDCDLTGSIAMVWLNKSLQVCSCDPIHLSLDTYLPVTASSTENRAQRSTTPQELFTRAFTSSTSTLSLEQFHNYQDVSTAVLQVARRCSPRNDERGFVLQRFSLQPGSGGITTKLLNLPEWRSYSGAILFPRDLLTNSAQNIACVKLRERGSHAYPDSTAFSYVVMEIKNSSGGGSNIQSNEDGNEGGEQQSGYQVTCGAQLEALDVCAVEKAQPSEDLDSTGAQKRMWRLLVLSITGKSLSFQTQLDQLESTGSILLNKQARRVFTSPLPLSASSAYFQTVGVRLLYLLSDGSSVDSLVLSDDGLGVPLHVNGCQWLGKPGEQVLDVQWNTSSSSNSVFTSAVLAAVWTTSRVVILSAPGMSEIRTYSLANDLKEPYSALWMGQTLLISTQDCQLRYMTPMVPCDQTGEADRGQLLCSLQVPNDEGAQTIQLVSICGDRLCYNVANNITGNCQTLVRPISLVEPLIMGFDKPSSPSAIPLLRAIFEREALLFLQAGGMDGPACPFSNALLETTYFRFGWKKATIQVLQALLGRSRDTSTSSTSGSSANAQGNTSTGTSSGFSRASHLSRSLLVALLADAKKWRDALRIFLSDDPALEEYAFSDVDDDGAGVSSAKLPSRTSQIACWFRALGDAMEAVGQSDLALKCLDLAGDDVAIIDTLQRLPASTKGDAHIILTALGKDLAKLNSPLVNVMESTLSNQMSPKDDARLDSAVWRRHDLHTLLCCESLNQTERRSRLLTTVRPFDKMAMENPQEPAAHVSEDQERLSIAPAKVLPWKRLTPEDVKDWTGATSAAVKISTDEVKPLNYSLFAPKTSSFFRGDSMSADNLAGSSMGGLSSPTAEDSNSAGSSSSSKMTIGPFLEEEDAVVAYWRFEEGATKAEEGASSSLESMDTSKRENHLKLQGLGSSIKLVQSTAPVDRGEEGKLQEEFALQFPATSSEANGIDSEPSVTCPAPTGGTLDVGFVFDDDPYRRKLTFEAWVRDYVLARELQQQQSDGYGDDENECVGSITTKLVARSTPNIRRPLVCRCGSNGSLWWELAIGDDSRLEMAFGNARLRADSPVENSGAWHHVAFTVDVTSSKVATLRLFLNARCVAVQEVPTVDTNASFYSSKGQSPASMIRLGAGLRDYEMTEVRVWASARSAEQLSDMKENYLAMAEAKRRMKIAIHQRNCTCAKCASRRAAPAAGAKKLSLTSPFPSAPASTASARDRRRPVAK